jgi:hypothetical protein
MRARVAFFATGLLLAAMACGHTESNRRSNPAPTSGGGATASAGSAGEMASDAGASDQRIVPSKLCDAWLHPECDEGDACTCRDDPRADCQSSMLCQRGTWRLSPGSCVDAPEPTPCPATPIAAKDMPCRPDGAVCHYPGDLSCHCQQPYDLAALLCADQASLRGPVPLLWFCGDASADCPVGIPDIGSTCKMEGMKCGDPCLGDYARQCLAGTWQRFESPKECL